MSSSPQSHTGQGTCTSMMGKRAHVHVCTYVDMYVHVCVSAYVCLHACVLMHTPRQGHFGTSCFPLAEMCCSVPLLCWKASSLWLTTRKERPVLAWSCCSVTFLWLFFLDTASQKGLERAARSKPAGSIHGGKPSRLGVQVPNPKL